MPVHSSIPAIVSAIGVLLCGCAPRIIVLPASADEKARADKPGVYYTLPKTRIETIFQLKKVTFVPGLLEPTKEELAEFPFLESKLPDGAPWAVKCPKDEKAKVRFLLDSASIGSTGVPDADHVYMLQLDASYFRDQDITLKLTPDGIPTAASVSVTDNRVDMAIALAADIARIVTLGVVVGKAPKGAAWDKKELQEEAIDELRRIARTRSALIHNGSTSGSVAERLKALADREAELALLWTGKLDEKTAEAKLTHIPPKSDSTPEAESQLGVFAPCAGVFDKQPDDVEHAWPIKHKFTADALSDDVLKKVIATDRLSKDVTDNKNKAGHGLVYRIPRAARYSVRVEEPAGADKKKKPDLASTRILVAQFGRVFYLPDRIGGKSTTTGLEFNPETGGIMVLTAKGTAANATPAQEALSDIVKRDDELAELERKHKILDFKKKIKDLENPPPPATTP